MLFGTRRFERVQELIAKAKKAKALINARNREKNKAKRGYTYYPKELARKINKMTNWQNSQWCRAGAKLNEVDKYLALVK